MSFTKTATYPRGAAAAAAATTHYTIRITGGAAREEEASTPSFEIMRQVFLDVQAHIEELAQIHKEDKTPGKPLLLDWVKKGKNLSEKLLAPPESREPEGGLQREMFIHYFSLRAIIFANPMVEGTPLENIILVHDQWCEHEMILDHYEKHHKEGVIVLCPFDGEPIEEADLYHFDPLANRLNRAVKQVADSLFPKGWDMGAAADDAEAPVAGGAGREDPVVEPSVLPRHTFSGLKKIFVAALDDIIAIAEDYPDKSTSHAKLLHAWIGEAIALFNKAGSADKSEEALTKEVLDHLKRLSSEIFMNPFTVDDPIPFEQIIILNGRWCEQRMMERYCDLWRAIHGNESVILSPFDGEVIDEEDLYDFDPFADRLNRLIKKVNAEIYPDAPSFMPVIETTLMMDATPDLYPKILDMYKRFAKLGVDLTKSFIKTAVKTDEVSKALEELMAQYHKLGDDYIELGRTMADRIEAVAESNAAEHRMHRALHERAERHRDHQDRRIAKQGIEILEAKAELKKGREELAAAHRELGSLRAAVNGGSGGGGCVIM